MGDKGTSFLPLYFLVFTEIFMKNIIVIGAGVGGLTTAALLAKTGLKVTVLEAHKAAYIDRLLVAAEKALPKLRQGAT